MRAFMRHTQGPTVSITDRKSAVRVKSTLTARFDFFRSMVSSKSRAAGFLCLLVRSA